MSAVKRQAAARCFSEGLAYQQAGLLREARAAYERGLALDPEQIDGRFLLGQTLFDSGECAAGERAMRATITARPQAFNYRAGLAISLFNAGRLSEAKPEFFAALQGLPHDFSLWRGMALCCTADGDVAGAYEAARVWRQMAPADTEAAGLCATVGAQYHFDRAVTLAGRGQRDEAERAYVEALICAPEAPAILTNLATLCAAQGRADEAQALYLRAIAAQADYAPAYFNLGMLHLDAGRRLDAATALEQAAALAPDDGLIAAHLLFQKMHLCRWDGIAPLARRVAQAVEAGKTDIPPFIVLSMPGSTADLQRRCAATHSAALQHGEAETATDRAVVPCPRNGRLRVGYLSSDFKNHATAYLMIEMLEAHDRRHFEIFALSYGIDDGSALRERLASACEHFIDLAALPERQAVQRISELKLDVLIDLKGYTEGNRSDWLQYRPAPVQINWLGYPGTLAAPWVDYLIADAVVAPLAHAGQFSERVLHLPGSYQPNSRVRECAPRPTRVAEGLPDDALVLCSFNQTYKITSEMFTLWLDILRTVPQAVLWLWASNPWAETALREVAQASAIDPSRLIFAEGRPQAEHLARLPLADLALDTFPCNGHTTTSDALWAGVPVLSLQGEAFAARVAASLLSAAGLPELIVDSAGAYRQTALRFAQDAEWRGGLTRRTQALREHSPLFDGVAFARKLEFLLDDCAVRHARADTIK